MVVEAEGRKLSSEGGEGLSIREVDAPQHQLPAAVASIIEPEI